MSELDRREFFAAVGLGAASSTFRAIPPVMSFPPHDQTHPGPDPWIELDHRALKYNLDAIRSRVRGRPIMAVIKGNGYGHGLIEMGRMLLGEGVGHMAVAKVAEALALREAGVEGMILNFGPFAGSDIPEIIRARISQTVFTDQVVELAREAKSRGKTTPVQVNIDTGLGRVGIPYREAVPFLRKVASREGVYLEGVFTALTEEPEFDRIQLRRFLEVCGSVEKEGIDVGMKHAASSAGLMNFPEAFLDMVRPGIAIYGHYPSDATWRTRPLDLRPVLSLKTGVVYVKTLAPGDALSYHRAFIAERRTRVATLPLGYSDGYPHTLADKADVLIRGRRFPIIALVTANHVLVNLGNDMEISIGDEAVLIGSQGTESIDAHPLAEAAGFSVYKLLIGMSGALPRLITR